MKDLIRRLKIRRFSINIFIGGYSRDDMHNAFSAGVRWKRGRDNAFILNSYSDEKIENDEPLFREWVKNYK